MVFSLLQIILFVKDRGLYFVSLYKVKYLTIINHMGDSIGKFLSAAPHTSPRLEVFSKTQDSI